MPRSQATTASAKTPTVSTPGSAGLSSDPEATIVDYVSGKNVRATAEEIDAVQVFARRLVDDYGYPKAHIRAQLAGPG